jgi:putative membrane protein
MMPRTPYERFVVEEMILRDHLAVDRTALANERTLLSYIRTALGMAAAGVSLLHFLEGAAIALLGWLLISSSVAALIVGVVRYRRVDQRIQHLYRPVTNRDAGKP